MQTTKSSFDEIREMGDAPVSQAPDSEITWLGRSGFSKANNEAVASSIIARVEAGEVNPLDAYVLAKSITSTAELITNGLKEMAIEEASKHGAKTFQYHGCKVEIKEAGVSYAYDGTGDIVWIELNKQLREIKEKIKEREAFLKNVTAPMSVTSEATGGETITITPPIKTSTTSLAITIK